MPGQSTQQNSSVRLKSGWLRPADGGSAGQPARRWRKGAEGQALVEFALTLPFIILLLVVLVELGLLIRSHMTVVAATREGVRVISARGSIDPSTAFEQFTSRVGTDGDSVLVQNVNTALQQERQNVTLLMTYRADVTEDLATGVIKDTATNRDIPTITGIYGIGGMYGVYYNPDISLRPFQEIFDYEERTAANGAKEKWFLPTVMSVPRCSSLYGSQEPAKPAGSTQHPTTFKRTYNSTFCGDTTKISESTGITRNIALGQVSSDGTRNNASYIANQKKYDGTGANSTCPNTPNTSIPYIDAMQCWRYNFAPWYPSLRRAADIGAAASSNVSSTLYFNLQTETAETFCKTSTPRSADHAGVQINYNHPWLLSFFPGPIPLSDKAVKLMEPTGNSCSLPPG